MGAHPRRWALRHAAPHSLSVRGLRSQRGWRARSTRTPPAQEQQQREDRELRGRDALLATVTVVPGEDQDDRQADQECDKRELADLLWPMEGLAYVLKTLQEPPCAGDGDESPLHDLPAAQACPEFCRAALGRAVH